MTGRSTAERYGWGIAFLVVAALSVPWFLWGSDAVVAGLPVWIWWHAGWMVLAALVFWAFARSGWGVWIVGPGRGDDGPTAEPATGDGGERP